MLGLKGCTGTWTDFEPQYWGLGCGDGRGETTALCNVPEWAMETLCDGINHASLSYSQGIVCPSPSCSYPPLSASGSAITSWWFKGKKHTCQENAKNFRVAFHLCGHCMDIPCDHLTCPLMQLLPPLHTLLVWHISHSTASTGAAGRSASVRGSAGIPQIETRLVGAGTAMGDFGSWSTAIAERVLCARGEQGGGGPREDGAG